MKKDTIYSLHSFLLPFMYVATHQKITSIFAKETPGNIWECADITDRDNASRVILYDEIDEKKSYYDAFQFFNEAGRNLIFHNEDDSIVKSFRVKSEKLDRMEYVIGVAEGEYRLPIRSIVLKFYNTDIALMVIECENYKYRSLDEVKRINEYGRRLGFPFWPLHAAKFAKCASYLKIENAEGKVLSEDDFRKYFQEQGRPSEVSLAYVSTVIRELLNQNGSGKRFRAKPVSGENEIQIRTLLDEKMYVATLIIDEDYVGALRKDYESGKEHFSRKYLEELTEVMRVDLPGECSIHNEGELREFIREHAYLSELSSNEGKMMTVTDQAYVKFISRMNYELEYFRCAYMPMIMIEIVQRNSISCFQQQILKLSESARKRINTTVIRRIMLVQQRYVTFCNQFMVSELTVQKEGRFLYDHLKRELRMEQENQNLGLQVGKLFELANLNQGYSFSRWALAISLIAMVCNCFSYALTAQELAQIRLSNYEGGGVLLLTSIIALGIIAFVILGKFQKRRK